MPAPFDPTGLQLAAVAAMNILVGVGTWFAARRKSNAAESAEIARHGVVETGATAESAVYKLLLDRVTQCEQDIRQARDELDIERKLRRSLENHIGRLEHMMRSAGLNPPALAHVETAGAGK